MMMLMSMSIRRETGIGGRWQDRVTGSCQGLRLFFGFLKREHVYDDVCKHLNVNYSAPREDMVTFKCKVLHLVKIKKITVL